MEVHHHQHLAVARRVHLLCRWVQVGRAGRRRQALIMFRVKTARGSWLCARGLRAPPHKRGAPHSYGSRQAAARPRTRLGARRRLEVAQNLEVAGAQLYALDSERGAALISHNVLGRWGGKMIGAAIEGSRNDSQCCAAAVHAKADAGIWEVQLARHAASPAPRTSSVSADTPLATAAIALPSRLPSTPHSGTARTLRSRGCEGGQGAGR